jgi:hypothetical protein
MTALYMACWALWLVGTALIVLSWMDVVSRPVGWIGFAVAAVGVLLSSAARKQPPQAMPPDLESEEPTDGPQYR